ncbi:hypothetical protein ACOI1C_11625 [Bacillus sp. DJP31]|uniref:hypothetical protein n=1 Tax=Bacillus sp. DJP31 TaxID=3409789 RepID=UPI003BB52FD0
MSILPDDLPRYGIEPKLFLIAFAVLISSSIPFFFIPRNLKVKVVVVDGGILINYPIWIVDLEEIPKWPTIGFRLSGQSIILQPTQLIGPVNTTIPLIRSMFEAHDKRHY